MAAVYPALPSFTSNLARPGHKLLDQVRDFLRVKHYAYRTDQAYVHSLKRFILFHDKMSVSKCPTRACHWSFGISATAGGESAPAENCFLLGRGGVIARSRQNGWTSLVI